MSVAPTYLERYLAGEREAVWAELVALGDRVREEPTLSDARAVAGETMRRARRNVERIVGRLRELDYRFTSPSDVHVPPDAATLAWLDRLEREAGPLPLALRAFFAEVGSVDLTGSHPRLSAYAEGIGLGGVVSAFAAALGRRPAGGGAPPPPAPADPPELAEIMANMPPATRMLVGGARSVLLGLMHRIAHVQVDTGRMTDQGGAMPPRLAENVRVAESLSAGLRGPAGAPPAGREAPASDPLVVWAPMMDDLDDYRELGDPEDPEARDDEGWTGRYVLEIAPDACHKANTSGGGPYFVVFPNAAADAPVEDEGSPTFVGYLRKCFRWGGFPGLAEEPEPPRAELAVLVEGLEEI